MIGLGLSNEARAAGAARVPEASPDWFVKPFNWGVGLGAPVVREFTRQALGVAKLRHPHIVQVVDAGSTADGTPFVVMERLAGVTLEERAGGTLIPLAELLPILRGVAAGLAAAHAVGVAHRELRADNVFMADAVGYAYGFPKLLNFGVVELTAGARTLGQGLAALASDAVPPEQGLDLTRGDAQSDQFALAALAYRFLAVAEITTAVELVLRRAMSWHPARRFDSLAAFLEALDVATRPQPETPRAPEIPEERPARPTLEAGALTQQFFAEGDRLEQAIERVASAGGPRADATVTADPDAGEDTLDLPERVPRRRAPMIAALALALVSSVIVGWTAISLSAAPRWPDGPASAAAQAPPALVAPISAASAAAPTRTASKALRALQPPKAARSNRPPTVPPPLVAPAAPSPVALPPAATFAAAPPPAPAVPTLASPPPAAPPAADPSAAAAPPTGPEAELGSAAAAAPPAIDQPVTQPPEPEYGAPIEGAPPAESTTP
jgi:serine/threonine-protein kinase